MFIRGNFDNIKRIALERFSRGSVNPQTSIYLYSICYLAPMAVTMKSALRNIVPSKSHMHSRSWGHEITGNNLTAPLLQGGTSLTTSIPLVIEV